MSKTWILFDFDTLGNLLIVSLSWKREGSIIITLTCSTLSLHVNHDEILRNYFHDKVKNKNKNQGKEEKLTAASRFFYFSFFFSLFQIMGKTLSYPPAKDHWSEETDRTNTMNQPWNLNVDWASKLEESGDMSLSELPKKHRERERERERERFSWH